MSILSKKGILPRGAFEWWRLITYIIFAGLLASIIGSSYFMYKYIYRTLDDAQIIVVLNSNDRVGIINMAALDKARALVQKKETAFTVPTDLRDIFNFFVPPYVTSTKR